MLLDNNIDIILGSETRLKPHIMCDNEFLHLSYTSYRRDRDDGYGGVLIITKNILLLKKNSDTQALRNNSNCIAVPQKKQATLAKNWQSET